MAPPSAFLSVFLFAIRIFSTWLKELSNRCTKVPLWMLATASLSTCWKQSLSRFSFDEDLRVTLGILSDADTDTVSKELNRLALVHCPEKEASINIYQGNQNAHNCLMDLVCQPLRKQQQTTRKAKKSRSTRSRKTKSSKRPAHQWQKKEAAREKMIWKSAYPERWEKPLKELFEKVHAEKCWDKVWPYRLQAIHEATTDEKPALACNLSSVPEE